ncbi:hypothetical protein [Tenacibaculum litopenaei]|uniref:hypothetical protein n=1 Tax=Tenacibaculum litopenaei TaxID=396016 RepID=UPI0038B5C6A8
MIKSPRKARKAVDNCPLAVNFTKTTTIPLLFNNNQPSNHFEKTRMTVDNCPLAVNFTKKTTIPLLFNNNQPSNHSEKTRMTVNNGIPSRKI